MSAIGLAELADRTLMEPGGWSAVVVDEAHIDATARALEEELTFWLEEEGIGRVRVFAERLPPPALIAELERMMPEDVALLPLPADIVASVSRWTKPLRGSLSLPGTGPWLPPEAPRLLCRRTALWTCA